MPSDKPTSGQGRSAAAVHALAVLAFGTCVGLAIWADATNALAHELRAGAIMAASACAVLWLWSALIALRCVWHAEPLRWPVTVLLLWLLEVLAARWRQSALLRYVDVDWLPVVRYVPQIVLLLVLVGLVAASWHRARLDTSAKRRPSAFASILPILLIAAAIEAMFLLAPTEPILVMNVDAICESAPARCRPPSPALLQRLDETKVTHNWVNVPLATVLRQLSDEAHTDVILDARDEHKPWLNFVPNSEMLKIPINLRVTDMKIGLTLLWVAKLANLEPTARGNVIIVSSRTSHLELTQEIVDLPVREGEAPWTLDETQRFCARGKESNFLPWCNSVTAVAGPGRLSIRCRASAISERKQFLRTPHAVPELAKAAIALETPISFSYVEPPANHSAGYQMYEKAALSAVKSKSRIFASFIPEANLPQPTDSVNSAPNVKHVRDCLIRDTLLEVRRRLEASGDKKWAITFDTRCPVVSFIRHDEFTDSYLDAIAEPAILDLYPAVRAGVPIEQLVAKLKTLIDESQAGFENPELIRNYWLARLDPWTAQRANALVQDAVKLGKLPDQLPPAPWFFATFPKRKPSEPRP
ncbi:MAG TPA: hypothetical protein VGP72_17925 [Planctomycetota bacterium]|jgi:hypothetical protein